MWDFIEKELNHKGWSLYRLSQETKLPWSTLKNIKNGTMPSFTTVLKIAQALDVDIHKFAAAVGYKS